MATKKNKMTGKDISTEALLGAIGDGATFAQIVAALGLMGHDRAVDGALQREKRKGRIRLGEKRRWVKTEEKPAKAKRSGRAG